MPCVLVDLSLLEDERLENLSDRDFKILIWVLAKCNNWGIYKRNDYCLSKDTGKPKKDITASIDSMIRKTIIGQFTYNEIVYLIYPDYLMSNSLFNSSLNSLLHDIPIDVFLRVLYGFNKQHFGVILEKIQGTNWRIKPEKYEQLKATIAQTLEENTFCIDMYKHVTTSNDMSQHCQDMSGITTTTTSNNTININTNSKDYEIPSEFQDVKTIYDQILLAWNEAKIIKHVKVNEVIKKAIDKILKEYDINVIIVAIKNYGIIINDKATYYFTYKWQLWEFLRFANVSRFIDSSCFNNFLAKDKIQGKEKPKERINYEEGESRFPEAGK